MTFSYMLVIEREEWSSMLSTSIKYMKHMPAPLSGAYRHYGEKAKTKASWIYCSRVKMDDEYHTHLSMTGILREHNTQIL